jgi:DNA/RNA-binding domain of Phe-tRNA-synthetase-like protein
VTRPGWIAPDVAAELPGLRLVEADAPAAPGRTPPELRARLRALSDRFGGARATGLRREAVPAAYRAFFRHVGLDPDVERPPAEAAVLDRLIHGGFRTAGMPADALLVAVVETGVPVWALDAARVEGRLGIRAAAPGEGDPDLVVADARKPVAVLFGAVDRNHVPTSATKGLRLFAIGVAGVPDLQVEEALWTCAEMLLAAVDRG